MAGPREVLRRDGCLLAYRQRGAAGPPVVFIQGVGVHGDGWEPQVGALAADHRCLTFDNRGMAASQPVGPAPLSIDQMADDTLALLDAVGWESAHVVGHSMGGLIALAVALRAPRRVLSLALMCTFANGADGASIGGRMLWLGLRSAIGTRRMRRHAFLEIVVPPDVLARTHRDQLAAELEPLFGHELAVQPPVAFRQLRAMSCYDATPRLGELASIPTLVLAGVHDPIGTPARGRALASGLPGARYVEFDDAAHGLPIQHCARVNALLAQHWGTAGNPKDPC